MLRALIVISALSGAWAFTTVTPQTVPESEFNCTGRASDHWYASPTDCDVYYRCPEAQRNALKYDCPAGSVFYEPNQGCDWDYNVPPPCGTSTSIPSYSTQTGGTVTTEAIPYYCTSVGRFPDPDCCTQFYVCSSQADNSIPATPQPCPDGLAFNPATEYCDFPANVPGCESLQCTK